MTSLRERWPRIEELLDDLLDLEPSEQLSELEKRTVDEPALRAAVLALLSADREPAAFLDGGVERLMTPVLDPEATSVLEDDSATRLLAGRPGKSGKPDPLPEAIGPYRVIRKLGQGGMGIVYEAEQTNPKRRVAIKVVRGGRFIDDTAAKMFEREVNVLARLRHPNIAGIYQSGSTEEELPYFAMELVEGETLDAHLRRYEGPIDQDELDRRLRLFRAIADAVHYAHQRGVIHRDLKPGNIIVTESAETDSGASSSSGTGLPLIKILDFGLARITEAEGDEGLTVLTGVGVIKGTLPYMSPEQARGDSADIDLRSDVYALGVILFEMLTGRRPLDLHKRSIADAIRIITETPPQSLRSAWKGSRKLDADLGTIVAKTLEKKPSDRYDSAGALSEDIERFRTDQPILARPPSTAYQLRKMVSRNKLATSFIAAIALMLLGFGIWMSVLWRQSESARAIAEASVLVTRGQAALEQSPSTSVAYAAAALRKADLGDARELALEALSKGPTVQIVHPWPGHGPAFSGNGERLAVSRYNLDLGRGELATFEAAGGEARWMTPVSGFTETTGLDHTGSTIWTRVYTAPKAFAVGVDNLAVPQPIEVGAEVDIVGYPDDRTVVLLRHTAEDRTAVERWNLERGALERSLEVPHRLPLYRQRTHNHASLSADGTEIGYAVDGGIFVLSLQDLEQTPRLIGRLPGASVVRFHPVETIVAVYSETSEAISLWSTERFNEAPLRELAPRQIAAFPAFDASGRYLAAGGNQGDLWVWDLDAPPQAQPWTLLKDAKAQVFHVLFHPENSWFVATDNTNTSMWFPDSRAPVVLADIGTRTRSIHFSADGRWLGVLPEFTETGEDRLTFWPMEGNEAPFSIDSFAYGIKLDLHQQTGRILVAGQSSSNYVFTAGPDLDFESGVAKLDLGLNEMRSAAFSPDGRTAAFADGVVASGSPIIRLFDLEAGSTSILDAQDEISKVDLLFLDNHRLVETGLFGMRLWDLETGTYEVLYDEEPGGVLTASADGRLIAWNSGPGIDAESGGVVRLLDLQTRELETLVSHGSLVRQVELSSDGRNIATASLDGAVRYGPVSGDGPHLLLGHGAAVIALALDPRGRWIASADQNGRLLLWPIPTGRPWHLEPREALVEYLDGLTNYRILVSSEESAVSGYELIIDDFRGWATPPPAPPGSDSG